MIEPNEQGFNNALEEEIVLTDLQWQAVAREWNSRKENPPSIPELIEIAFGRKDLDGRSKEGRAIKKKLSSSGVDLPKSKYKPKGLIELTQEQKDFIDNNHKAAHPLDEKALNSLEIAKILFNKRALTNLDTETRTVASYARQTFPESFLNIDENTPEGDYSAPRTPEGVLTRINKYIFHGIDKSSLTGKQKKDINSLLGYMNNFRFLQQINSYSSQKDRDLFESTFLRYTYDKFDLAQEEVDQYTVLATEVVIAASIQRRLELLNNKLDDATNNEDKSISMSWVEAIGKTQSEYNACISRQQKLLDSLKMKRSEKEGKGKEGQASILNLVELAKQEESRVKLIKLAQKRQEGVENTISEFMTMDELKSRIVGITENEILNG